MHCSHVVTTEDGFKKTNSRQIMQIVSKKLLETTDAYLCINVQLYYKPFCLTNVKYAKLWCHQTEYTNYRYNAEQKLLATGLKERIL